LAWRGKLAAGAFIPSDLSSSRQKSKASQKITKTKNIMAKDDVATTSIISTVGSAALAASVQ
jgi:hypothetical protein